MLHLARELYLASTAPLRAHGRPQHGTQRAPKRAPCALLSALPGAGALGCAIPPGSPQAPERKRSAPLRPRSSNPALRVIAFDLARTRDSVTIYTSAPT